MSPMSPTASLALVSRSSYLNLFARQGILSKCLISRSNLAVLDRQISEGCFWVEDCPDFIRRLYCLWGRAATWLCLALTVQVFKSASDSFPNICTALLGKLAQLQISMRRACILFKFKEQTHISFGGAGLC